MIKTLRFRFMAAAMLSLFAVLSVIISAINIINYGSIVDQCDQVLLMLSEGKGHFETAPQMQGERPQMQPRPLPESPRHSPELPYETRYFTVLLNDSGAVQRCDLSRIAAVDEQTAATMANDVYFRLRDRGFYGSYRYRCTKDGANTRIIFMDCSRPLSNFYTFLWVSVAISAAGLAAVWVLLFFLSGRIIRPILVAQQKQKQFITDAGHELKTPLTVIDADAEVLEMEVGQNEWLTDIRRQTKSLASLTNDLIYLSRLEEQQPTTMLDFPLGEIVKECAASFEALSRTQNKVFITRIPEQLSYCGDEKALRQLTSLLLDNALKYSPEGGQITLELAPKGKGVLLAVSNTTREALHREQLEQMFERFYRGDPSRAAGGHGIGLSIARAITEAHKGKITATAQGTNLTISVLLP